MTSTNLSFPEARAVVLHYCEDFHAAHSDTTPEDHAVHLEDLTLKLSWFLGAIVPGSYLEDVVEVLAEFAKLEDGDHPGLTHTANGAIDEGGYVRDRLNAMLNDQLYYVVTAAGIRAARNELVIAA